MKKGILLNAFTLTIIINLFLSSIGYSQVNNSEKEIDISTSAHKVFFNLSNLKPGDYFTKELTVSNKGKQNFSYLFSNKFLTGSEKFYNEILLKVSDNKQLLFEGKLKDFTKLEARRLESSQSEKLYFWVKVPYELGNDFQGLGCEFQFKFYAEGTLGGILPTDGPKLPNTATGVFNLMLIGISLIVGGIGFFYYAMWRRKTLMIE
ncbi:LPXTG cell wall anchor domain-containing protein [Mesobacillus jeotgali]|uniref:LPXTG cell wall anchor domain-containing protein n=1 Tax=Mesobacillus jeotgali TaxID=129985 RepID=UPI000C8454DF|nr:LPXTG cell wall anchor domain-containing protein [Mesobacillus jeotgali]